MSFNFGSKLLSAGNRFVKQMASQTTSQAAKKTQSGATAAGQQRPGLAPTGLNARAGGAKVHPEPVSQQPRANLQSFRQGTAPGTFAGQAQPRTQTPAFQPPQSQPFAARPGSGYQRASSPAPTPRQETPQPVGLQHFGGSGRSDAPPPGLHRASLRPTSPARTAEPARPQQAASQASFARARPEPAPADHGTGELRFARGTKRLKAQYMEAKARMDALVKQHHQMDGQLDMASDEEYDALEEKFEALGMQKKAAVREHNALRNEMARMNIPVAHQASKVLSENLAQLQKLANMSGNFPAVDQMGMDYDLKRTMARSGKQMVSTFRTAREFQGMSDQRQAILDSQEQLKDLLETDEMKGLRYADPKLHASLTQMVSMDLDQMFGKLDRLQEAAGEIKQAFARQDLEGLLYSIPTTPEERQAQREQELRDHAESLAQGYRN